MKKINLLTFCILCIAICSSQSIPNSSFESWSGGGVGWIDNNGVWPGSLTQSTNAHTGNYAARMNITHDGNGNHASSLQRYLTVNNYPAALHGWYILNKVGDDELIVGAFITGNGSHTNLGTGDLPVYSTSSLVYKEFTQNIIYTNQTISADTALIAILLMSHTGAAASHLGSYAIIDDLSFGPAATVGLTQIQTGTNLETCFPNPAADILNIIYSLDGSGMVSLCLYDITGKKIKSLFENENQTSGRLFHE